jgi:hypothetical protein
MSITGITAIEVDDFEANLRDCIELVFEFRPISVS